MKVKLSLLALSLLFVFASCNENSMQEKEPVDYVNPYMGNISHLLVPTYPTTHLPNGMMRVFPQRGDYTSDIMHGLPVLVTHHRGSSAFLISPTSKSEILPVMDYSYDNEKVTPYRYSVFLDEEEIKVDYAPSYQSAIYSFEFEKGSNNQLIILSRGGEVEYKDNAVQGVWDLQRGNTKVYLYLETEQQPESAGDYSRPDKDYFNRNILVLKFKDNKVNARYGVSYISIEQAKKNLSREIQTYDVDEVAEKGRAIWNEALGKIKIEDSDENNKAIFYTSLYRTYERMVSISEDGSYYSAYDQQVHEDGGQPFFVDDWIWDTYRATHPLRVLIDSQTENNMIHSYIRQAIQSEEGWFPTFPEVTGDSHGMNGNHGVAVVIDAYRKGLRGFELETAYNLCYRTAMERSRLPWVKVPNTELDKVYLEKGYFPALHPGEKETVKEVHDWEKREVIAITLAACYDDWCLAQIAKELGKTDDYNYFLKRSYLYRNVFNKETAFFHPKDKNGNFIEPFDYTFSGGIGARDYYDENNAWTYRWDVPHNPADLIDLMGSPENFVNNLDGTFRAPLGKSKWQFYAQIPDQTGNVGQFSMGNEPSLHIPYLYNYAGQPWKTQKRTRELVEYWFRNDLMGVPGDEDGGGLSAFVVFTMLGFYPVTPGLPVYNIGSPVFGHAAVQLENGVFEIEAQNCSRTNKYIQSATLNGKEWNKPWFTHDDIRNGGKLVLVMGERPNKEWGSDMADVPPSAEPLN